MTVSPLDRDSARKAAEALGVPEGMTRLSVFQVLLRHPALAKPFNDLLMCLLFSGSLDVRLRELVIMRMGWVTGSVYEWTQHWGIAQVLGIDPDDLLAVRDWHSAPASQFTPVDRAALAAVDDVASCGYISPTTWVAVEEALPDRADQVELAMLVSTYAAVSVFLRSLEVPLEEGVEPWPPDGLDPGRATPPESPAAAVAPNPPTDL